MKFFVLLHTAERAKRSFSCFCTLQKEQKEVFHAAAHCRKTKKKFFTLLHAAERPKRRFSRFCTLQKGQKEVFHAFAHCRKAKKKFFILLHTAERPNGEKMRFCQRHEHEKMIFSLKASRGSMEFWFQLLYDNNAYRPAIGWGRSSFIFVFLSQFLVFFS